MARWPSPPRVRRSLFGAVAAAGLAVYIGSARYCFTVSLGQRAAVSIIAGALVFRERAVVPPRALGPPGIAAPAAPTKFRYETVYFYRHTFRFAWWFAAHSSLVTGDRWVEVPLWMPGLAIAGVFAAPSVRSEEHTSELQSRFGIS